MAIHQQVVPGGRRRFGCPPAFSCRARCTRPGPGQRRLAAVRPWRLAVAAAARRMHSAPA